MVDNAEEHIIQWSWGEALLSFILVFMLSVIIHFINWIYPHLFDNFFRTTQLPRVLTVSILLSLGILPVLIGGGFSLFLVYFFVVKKNKGNIKDLRISKEKLWRNIFLGLFLGIVIAFFYKFIDFSQDVMQNIKPTTFIGPAYVVFYSIFIEGFFAGIWQEIFFVSFFYLAFKKKFGCVVAFFITTCFFALGHNPIPIYWVPKYFTHPVISILLFEKRKSIIPSIVFHATHNILL